MPMVGTGYTNGPMVTTGPMVGTGYTHVDDGWLYCYSTTSGYIICYILVVDDGTS